MPTLKLILTKSNPILFVQLSVVPGRVHLLARLRVSLELEASRHHRKEELAILFEMSLVFPVEKITSKP